MEVRRSAARGRAIPAGAVIAVTAIVVGIAMAPRLWSGDEQSRGHEPAPVADGVDLDGADGWPTSGETPATIDTGERARTTLSYGLNCEAGSGVAPLPYDYAYSDIDLVLADGSQVGLPFDINSVCVPRITRYYRDNSWPTEPPARWDSLVAELTVPESVAAGETLVYLVTLRNTGDQDLDLSPCGGYAQELLLEDMDGTLTSKPVYQRYRLNCDAEPVLPARGERSYVMHLEVPADAPATDEARLTWQLVDTLPDQGGQGYVMIRH